MLAKSRPFRILAIDGGGIRGAIPAEFLRRLEHDLGRPLHESFDYIAGTSAGGLLALFIGGRGGSAAEAASLFSAEKAGRIMNKSLLDRVVPTALQPGPKYDGTGKTAVLREVFGGERMLYARTPILVTAYDPAAHRFVAFKSHGGGDASPNPLMAEVANATSAAPVYFPPAAVEGPPHRLLVDGGLGANNPAMAAIAEALKGGVSPEDIVVVSLGTGRRPIEPQATSTYERESEGWGGMDWLRNGLVDHFLDASSSATDYWCRQILGDRYVRVQHALADASPELDDVSEGNLAALRSEAGRWYERDGPRVLDAVMFAPPRPVHRAAAAGPAATQTQLDMVMSWR